MSDGSKILSTLSDEQQQVRLRGIGSSEIAAILGRSPFTDSHTVWRRKTGRESMANPATLAMERGIFVEGAILEWLAHRAAVVVEKVPTRQHDNYPHVVDSADGVALREGQRIATIEAKCIAGRSRHEWGDPEDGDAAIPVHYYLQGQWHCGVWGLPECIYPVFDGYELHIFVAQAKPDLFNRLAEFAEQWWARHVDGDEPPPLTGCRPTTEWLNKHFSEVAKPPRLLHLDGTAEELARELLILKEQQIELQTQADAIQNYLKQIIGAAEGLENTQLKVMWSQVARKTTKWENVARELKAPPELIAKHTSTALSRRFTVREKK